MYPGNIQVFTERERERQNVWHTVDVQPHCGLLILRSGKKVQQHLLRPSDILYCWGSQDQYVTSVPCNFGLF